MGWIKKKLLPKKSCVILPGLNKDFSVQLILLTFGFSCILHQSLWPRVDLGMKSDLTFAHQANPLVQAISRGRGAFSSTKGSSCTQLCS